MVLRLLYPESEINWRTKVVWNLIRASMSIHSNGRAGSLKECSVVPHLIAFNMNSVRVCTRLCISAKRVEWRGEERREREMQNHSNATLFTTAWAPAQNQIFQSFSIEKILLLIITSSMLGDLMENSFPVRCVCWAAEPQFIILWLFIVFASDRLHKTFSFLHSFLRSITACSSSGGLTLQFRCRTHSHMTIEGIFYWNSIWPNDKVHEANSALLLKRFSPCSQMHSTSSTRIEENAFFPRFIVFVMFVVHSMDCIVWAQLCLSGRAWSTDRRCGRLSTWELRKWAFSCYLL